MKKIIKGVEVSYEEALEACIRHYTARRNPREHAEMMLKSIRNKEYIFEIYEIAQKQTEELLALCLIDEDDPACIK